MSYKEYYYWDDERGHARFEIEDKNHMFIGHAQCHPDDMIVKNENFGIEIAEIRARLEQLRYIRDNEIKPALKALKHLHATMATSKHYNKKSYEAKMLWRQIKYYESCLESIRLIINEYNNYIKRSSELLNIIKQRKENGQI